MQHGVGPGIIYNDHMEGDGEVDFRHACGLGCEGIVSKRADSPYRSVRSRDWIKTKSPVVKAQQRIYRTADYPSHVELEVLPGKE
jgi:ATP-dependent DNA ligase